jgi:hypothetical protein
MRPYLDLSLLGPAASLDPFKTIDTEPSSKVPAALQIVCEVLKPYHKPSCALNKPI